MNKTRLAVAVGVSAVAVLGGVALAAFVTGTDPVAIGLAVTAGLIVVGTAVAAGRWPALAAAARRRPLRRWSTPAEYWTRRHVGHQRLTDAAFVDEAEFRVLLDDERRMAEDRTRPVRGTDAEDWSEWLKPRDARTCAWFRSCREPSIPGDPLGYCVGHRNRVLGASAPIKEGDR